MAYFFIFLKYIYRFHGIVRETAANLNNCE